MGLLDSLLGGSDQTRQDYQDFVQRYERGRPWEGISDEEAVNRYRETARELSPDQYEASAQEAFEQLTPQERRDFARWLQQRARQRNTPVPGLEGEADVDRLQGASDLARLTGELQRREPGLLDQLMSGSGGSGSLLDNPSVKAALAGIAATAARKVLGSR